MPKKASKPQVPLKEMLGALDRRDKDFYNNLNEEMKKAFSSWTAMRYASSCQGKSAEHYLLTVNEFVNCDFSVFTKEHPELQWKLLAICGVGQEQYHPWIPPGRKKGKNKIQAELSKVYPNLKNDDLAVLESILNKDELEETFINAGYDEKEIKEIVK